MIRTGMRVVERVKYAFAAKLGDISYLGFFSESDLPAKGCNPQVPEAMGPNLLLKETRKHPVTQMETARRKEQMERDVLAVAH